MRRVTMLLLLSMGAGGCGNLTAGGFGEATAYVQGDEPGPSGTAEPAALQVPFSGDVTARLEILLRDEGGEWHALTAGPAELVVDVRGEDREEAGRAALDPGRYDRVRVIFTKVEAELIEGPPGLALPVGGRVRVDFGAAQALQVERPVLVELAEDGQVALIVNLGSGLWLATAVLGVVAPAAFESAVQVRVEG